MSEFEGDQIEIGDALMGKLISEVRVSRRSGNSVERLALLFEDGATLSLDGRFPANASVQLSDETIAEIKGQTFVGITFKRRPAGPVCDGTYLREMLASLAVEGRVFDMNWIAVGHTDFDVEPELRLHFRPADTHYGVGYGS